MRPSRSIFAVRGASHSDSRESDAGNFGFTTSVNMVPCKLSCPINKAGMIDRSEALPNF